MNKIVFKTSMYSQQTISGGIKDLIQQFSLEARSGQYEYSRALADFTSRDENALNLRKGDIVAIVRKDDPYTQRGWLYGIKEGQYGLFPADYVEKLSPNSIRFDIENSYCFELKFFIIHILILNPHSSTLSLLN